MTTGHLSTIQTSLEIVREERRRTVCERDAFSEFATTIASLDPSPPNTTTSQMRPLLVGSKQTDTSEIEQAYRESIMSVPHYEEEYDETLAVNLRAELGSEIAAAVINSKSITPQLQQVVTAAAETAQNERAEFIITLDTEQNKLETARKTLSEVNEMLTSVLEHQWYTHSFDEIHEMYQQLIQGQSQCRKILQDRQKQRKTGHARICSESILDLQNYLYQDMSATYPVLSGTLKLYEDLRLGRHRIEYWLTRYD